MLKKLLSISILVCAFSWAQAFSVTFQVDMSQQSGFTTPEVNGTFNTWCGNCFQMTDANGDNIWEATTDLPAGTHEFKFSADNWGIQETLLPGSACTVTSSGFTNRTISVTGDVVLPVVCWGSCLDCASSPNVYTVVFQVDMSNVDSAFTTPEVNGTFNGWCGSCTAMFDPEGDNIWSVPVVLQEGNYEYKFSHDTWLGQEPLVAGSSCTLSGGGYTNRTISVTGNDTLEAVCYGSCTPCGQSSGPYNVTFAVDMSEVAFSYITPEVNGDFNIFCGSCAPMSDPDGDHIYTITIPLNPGSYVYKFSYDNWSGQEELIPGSACTLTESGFTNRSLEVTENTVLSSVCWSSCETCTVGVGESQNQKMSVYPNPSNGILNIILPTLDQVSVSLKDMTGRAVLSTTSNRSAQLQLDVASFASGTYVLEVANGKELRRQVVQLVK